MDETKTNIMPDFLEQYKSLPTREDQKIVRHRFLKAGKIKKSTFYTWVERNKIADDKAILIANEVMQEYKRENNLN